MILRRSFCRPASRCRSSRARRSPCLTSRPTRRACRGCRPISRRTIWNNPYIDYTAERLYDFLSNHKLGFKPGTHYEYANLGFGLLGHILELRAGRSYEELVVSRICAPLGHGRHPHHPHQVRCNSAWREGHNAGLAPVANWDFLAMAGAGALRSTANDLLKFLQAVPRSRRYADRRRAEDDAVRAPPDGREQRDVALGWFVSSRFGDEVVWKSGGTGGYATFIGYSTKNAAKPHPALQCGRLRHQHLARHASGQRGVPAAKTSPRGAGRSGRAGKPMPAATKYRRLSS